MQPLPLSALLEIITAGTGQPSAAPVSSKEQFSALLGIGSRNSVGQPSEGRDATPDRRANTDARRQDNPASTPAVATKDDNAQQQPAANENDRPAEQRPDAADQKPERPAVAQHRPQRRAAEDDTQSGDRITPVAAPVEQHTPITTATLRIPGEDAAPAQIQQDFLTLQAAFLNIVALLAGQQAPDISDGNFNLADSLERINNLLSDPQALGQQPPQVTQLLRQISDLLSRLQKFVDFNAAAAQAAGTAAIGQPADGLIATEEQARPLLILNMLARDLNQLGEEISKQPNASAALLRQLNAAQRVIDALKPAFEASPAPVERGNVIAWNEAPKQVTPAVSATKPEQPADVSAEPGLSFSKDTLSTLISRNPQIAVPDRTAAAPGITAAVNTHAVAASIVTAAADNSSPNMNSGGNGNNNGGVLTQSTAPTTAAGQPGASQGSSHAVFSRILEQSATRQVPVPEQVILHIRAALSDGSNRIHIQLWPEELGKLEIRLNVSADGKTGVTVTADNRQTLELLQRDARGLQQALADAGLQTDSGSLNFNLRGGEQQNNGQQHVSLPYPPVQEEEPILPANILTRSYVVNLAEGVDIIT